MLIIYVRRWEELWERLPFALTFHGKWDYYKSRWTLCREATVALGITSGHGKLFYMSSTLMYWEFNDGWALTIPMYSHNNYNGSPLSVLRKVVAPHFFCLSITLRNPFATNHRKMTLLVT